MKKILFLVLAVFSHVSFAGLVGVSYIEVRSALPDYLQVSELVATQTNTLTNVALATNGSTATSSSDFPGFSALGATDGDVNSLFHSGGSTASEWLKVTLASPTELNSITIYGRVGGNSNRDKYNLKVYNSLDALIFSADNLDATVDHLVNVNLPNTNTNNVSEPESIFLLLIGLVGLVARKVG
jgi:hypothetical protein